MDFPITELMDQKACLHWLETHFHPSGLKCPHCQADVAQAKGFRQTKRSQLPVYRCQACGGIYNVYSGTVFEGRDFRAEQTVLFLRGVLQGIPTAQLARELRISRITLNEVRHQLQANAEREQSQDPLEDLEVETDELFQNSGKKGDWHGNPLDPPRRRANKRRGRGTFANDRPPVCAVFGRMSRQIRIRVMKNTQGDTLCPFVERFTRPEATLYTDEYDSYNCLKRIRHTVCHAQKEWARDEDGDGVREVHINSNEGIWTGLRNFLRSFRGVHKKYLSGYVAIFELSINHKSVSPELIAAIVHSH